MSEKSKIGGRTQGWWREVDSIDDVTSVEWDALIAAAFRLAEVERETIERCARKVGDMGGGFTIGEYCRALRSLPLTAGEVE